MDPIKFAIAGCGGIAYRHAEAIAAVDSACLTSVYDIDVMKARNFAGEFQVRWRSSFEEVLEDKDVDVVSICTPSVLHTPMAAKAALAGKHVLVEKPMALTLEEADALISVCQRTGVQLGVVLQNRFKPSVKFLKKSVEEGCFGKLTHGAAVVRWNRNQEYYRQSTWRGRPEQGGGVLINQAIHNIDLLQWVMGPVESLSAYTARQLLDLDVEDVAVAVLKFKSGALGAIEAASTIFPGNLEESISIFGETGTAIIGGKKADSIKYWQSASGTEPPPEALGFVSGNLSHVPCVEDMVHSIRTGTPPVINGWEGRKSLELVLAIHLSVRERRAVNLI